MDDVVELVVGRGVEFAAGHDEVAVGTAVGQLERFDPCVRGGGVVAGDHDDSDPRRAALREGVVDALAYRAAERDEPDATQRSSSTARSPLGAPPKSPAARDHAHALRRQRVVRRRVLTAERFD